MLIFLKLVVFFLVFGSVFLGYYLHIKQVIQRYDNKCTLGATCTVVLNIPDDMTAPIFFYYELDNFF